jgi:hypothetical protein
LHGLERFIIDNGQRIGDTVITVNQGRNTTGLNAMTQVELYDEYGIPLGRNGKYGQLQVRADRFNATVHDHIYSYGLRQILNDAMADKTDDDGAPLPTDQIVAKAEKRLASLYAGELRTRISGAPGEPTDPVEREAFNLAREQIKLQFQKLGLWPKKGTDKFQQAVDARRIATHSDPMLAADYIAAWLERNPKVNAAAKRIVAERAKADESEMV